MYMDNETKNSGKGNYKHKSTRKGSEPAIGGTDRQVRDFCKSKEGSWKATASGWGEQKQKKGKM